MLANADDFRNELENILNLASREGKGYVDVNSGELHRKIGGYPNGGNHRMATCCSVMRSIMKSVDNVIDEPLKGKGAALTIRYSLPR